jgi:hypothetical protein
MKMTKGPLAELVLPATNMCVALLVHCLPQPCAAPLLCICLERHEQIRCGATLQTVPGLILQLQSLLF